MIFDVAIIISHEMADAKFPRHKILCKIATVHHFFPAFQQVQNSSKVRNTSRRSRALYMARGRERMFEALLLEQGCHSYQIGRSPSHP